IGPVRCRWMQHELQSAGCRLLLMSTTGATTAGGSQTPLLCPAHNLNKSAATGSTAANSGLAAPWKGMAAGSASQVGASLPDQASSDRRISAGVGPGWGVHAARVLPPWTGWAGFASMQCVRRAPVMYRL